MVNKIADGKTTDKIFGPQEVERESLIFTGILILALVLRVVFLLRIQCIAPDSPTYIYLTQDLIDKGFKDFFSHGFASVFTIYPIFIYLLNFIVGDLLVSAELVSLIFGTAVIFPLYFIARKLVGVRAGLVTAFFLAVHIYLIRYSGEVLKDATLFFFSVFALYFAFAGSWKRSYFFIFLAGVFAWITVLVRLYGIILIFAIPFALLVSELKDRRNIKEILTNLALFLVPIPLVGFIIFTILVGPDQEFVIGSFTRLVMNLEYANNIKFAEMLLNNIPHGVGEEYLELITGHFYLVATMEFINVLATAFTGFLFVLFIAGLYLDRKNLLKDKSRLFIISFTLPFFAFDFGILITHFIITKRQLLPLIIVLFPWSGLSLAAGLWWLKDKMSNSTGFLKKSARWIIPVVIFIWSVSTLLYISKPYREKMIYQKEAGEYIKEVVGEDSKILARSYASRVIFYSGGEGEYFYNPDDIKIKIDRINPDYLLWDTHMGPTPEVFGKLEEEGIIKFEKKFSNYRDEVVYIYRIIY